ncbi:LANO_0F03092g1_1 [Lachancea nothofagi CBS 11611]|uniref:LANO_0F03092g1_1 n=1 Tax=Lachancea nothofagi CBS 11611 TaxID=1266666 RepID=A0A1G4K6Z7_9SACH|nr:LANO_0F03092g1_1 [Lachancea nothofagi CBS 11611]
MISHASNSRLEVVVEDPAFIDCLSDIDDADCVYLIKENEIIVFNTRSATTISRSRVNLENTVAVCLSKYGSPRSKYLVALKSTGEVLMFRLPDLCLLNKKRLKYNKPISNETFTFFDSKYERLHICVGNQEMLYVDSWALLSPQSGVQGHIFYQTASEIKKCACLSLRDGVYLISKKDVIDNRLKLEMVDFEITASQNQTKTREGYGSIEKIVTELAGSTSDKLLGFFVFNKPRLAVVVTSRTLFVAVRNRYTKYDNRGLKKMYALSSEDKISINVDCHFGNNYLKLAMFDNRGNIYSTGFGLWCEDKNIMWRRIQLKKFPGKISDLCFCKILSKTSYVLNSLQLGCIVLESEKQKVLYHMPCNQLTYLDAIVTNELGSDDISSLVACGGVATDLGFVECISKVLSKETLKIIEIDEHYEDQGIQDFWLTANEIETTDIFTQSKDAPCHISCEKVRLSCEHALCALQLTETNDMFLYLDTNFLLHFVKNGTDEKMATPLPGLSRSEMVSLAASKNTDHRGVPQIIVIAEGNKLHVSVNGVITIAIVANGSNIRNVCLKQLSTTTDPIIVMSDDSGLVSILSYSLLEKNICILKRVQFEDDVPAQLCDIRSTFEEQCLVFVYNRLKVRILDVLSGFYHAWPYDYSVKLIKPRGTNKFVVLTVDDILITVQLSRVLASEWKRRKTDMHNQIITHVLELENPRYVVLTSQTIDNVCRLAIFDTEALQIMSEYTLPSAGTVRKLLKLRSPYKHEIVVSFSGKSPNSDCLLIMSVLQSKLVHNFTHRVEKASCALAQMGNQITHAGAKILTFELQKETDKWTVAVIGQPFLGTGPLSMTCSMSYDNMLVVLDATVGLCVYDLSLKKRVHRTSTNGLSSDHFYDNAAVLCVSRTPGCSMADYKSLFSPVKRSGTQLSLLNLQRSVLSIWEINVAATKSRSSVDDAIISIREHSTMQLPSSRPITKLKQISSSLCVVCARGGISILNIAK